MKPFDPEVIEANQWESCVVMDQQTLAVYRGQKTEFVTAVPPQP